MGLTEAAINHMNLTCVTHFLTDTDCKILANYRQNIFFNV
jgi:hypothetical protein